MTQRTNKDVQATMEGHLEGNRWYEIWTEGPQGAMRVLAQGDIQMGDQVKLSVVPFLMKAHPDEKGSFPFLPQKVDFFNTNKGLIVDEGEYLEQ